MSAGQAQDVPATRPCAGFAQGWAGGLVVALGIYVAAAAVCMQSGIFSDQVTHYVGLLADGPANLVAVVLAFAAARQAPIGAMRSAWWAMAVALLLYLVGGIIATSSWLLGRDPFPGPADLFFSAFYPAILVALFFLIRAAALRVPWARLALDATILVAGFGAFFWFLVIRPAAASVELDIVKQALSQAYVAMNCVVLLGFGVLLIAGAATIGGRRIPLLLLFGFATMFVADILWSLGKVGGGYLPGGLQDALYLACYVPLAAAAREQMRARADSAAALRPASDLFVYGMPYAAMLAAFLVLVYFTRDGTGGPASTMTIVVFVLTLLLMARQGVISRDDARTRERYAANLVEARYVSLIANASDVIMVVAPDGALRFSSPASERMFGLRSDEISGRNLLDLWAGEDHERLRSFLTDVAATKGETIGPQELNVEGESGRRTVEVVGSNLSDDPAVAGLALNFRDISERKALEDQLRRLAFHDPLTLLANRNLFRDRVQHAVALAQRSGQHIAVMFLDLDNFKNINDSLGHDAGDRLLQAAAQRLLKSTRSSDTVARLGGDEFAVLLENVGAVANAERVATAVIQALSEPFMLAGTEVRVAASIGVALSTADVSAEELLSNADIAMYGAKTAGKHRYVVFEPRMQEALRERLRVEADIRRALLGGEFFLEYQPIVDLGTRSLLGVEALLRWRHPERGLLMPGRFIQVAEESGQIIELSRWVLLEACRSMRQWRDAVAGGQGLRLAVNVSGRHLQHGDLVADVALALAESGLEPSNLVIELTESTIMHNTEANLTRLHKLKALGVRLAIDDFGTGYSSLSYLHRFPIDILKIDRSFISRLTNDDDGPELARAVVTLGDTLGLDTVAEGIEQEAQVAALLELGCVAGQGYLFARPGPLQQLLNSPFAARRAALWRAQDQGDAVSATGRFAALKVAGAG